MPNSRDFVAHIIELMRPSRAIAKPMFGGHGIYVDGLFVAIVTDDTLYLKTDDASRGAFDALSLPPFEFKTKDGRGTASGYRRAPDEALESGAEMRVWLRRAIAAALARPRARVARPRKTTVKRVR